MNIKKQAFPNFLEKYIPNDKEVVLYSISRNDYMKNIF